MKTQIEEQKDDQKELEAAFEVALEIATEVGPLELRRKLVGVLKDGHVAKSQVCALTWVILLHTTTHSCLPPAIHPPPCISLFS